jgi:hypothetical protein
VRAAELLAHVLAHELERRLPALLVALALALSACGSGGKTVAEMTPVAGAAASPSAEASRSADTSAPAAAESQASTEVTHYTATNTDDEIALGTEMQRDRDWKLGAEIWAMTTTGKPVMHGRSPQFAVTALKADGSKQIFWYGGSSNEKTFASQQTAFTVQIPSMTTTIVVTTTLKREGGNGESPRLVIPLAGSVSWKRTGPAAAHAKATELRLVITEPGRMPFTLWLDGLHVQ